MPPGGEPSEVERVLQRWKEALGADTFAKAQPGATLHASEVAPVAPPAPKLAEALAPAKRPSSESARALLDEVLDGLDQEPPEAKPAEPPEPDALIEKSAAPAGAEIKEAPAAAAPAESIVGLNPEREFGAMLEVRGLTWHALLHPETLAEPARREAARARKLAVELPLAERLEGNLRVLRAVCGAVAFAHSRHVLHRDLKPENVRVGPQGEVLVTGWELALGFGSPADAEREGVPHRTQAQMGATFAYAAPEQLAGGVDALTPATDLFQLGGLLHEVLTGRAPHAAPTLETSGAQALECAVPEFPADVPAELGALCRKALSKAPAARGASVNEFQAELEACLRRAEVRPSSVPKVEAAPAPPPVPPPAPEVVAPAKDTAAFSAALAAKTAQVIHAEQALKTAQDALAEEASKAAQASQEAERLRAELSRKQASNSPMLRAGFALAVVLLVVVGVAWYLARAERNQAVAINADEARKRQEAEAQRGEAESQLSAAQEVQRAAEAARLAADQEREKAAQKLSGEMLSGASALLEAGNWLEAQRKLGEVRTLKPGVRETLADLLMLGLRRHAPLPLTSVQAGTEAVLDLDVAPDGRTVVLAQGTQVRVLDLFSGKVLAQKEVPTGKVQRVRFLPGAQRFATGSASGTITIRDARSAEVVHELKEHRAPVLALACDGARLRSADAAGVAMTWDVEKGTLLESAKIFDEAKDIPLALVPDAAGRVFVALGVNRNVQRYTLPASNAAMAFQQGEPGGDNGVQTALALSADGKVAFGADRNGRLTVWETKEGKIVRQFGAPSAPLTYAALNADGSLGLACCEDGSARIWDLRDGRERSALLTAGTVARGVFTPENRVVLGNASGLVQVWRVGDEGGLRDCAALGAEPACVRLSPDGQMFASGDAGGQVALWDCATGRSLARWTNPRDPADAVAFTRDGTRLAVHFTQSKAVKILDLNTGAVVKEYAAAGKLVFSPDAQRALSVDANGAATLLDATSGAVLEKMGKAGEESSRTFYSSEAQAVLHLGEVGLRGRLLDSASPVRCLDSASPVRCLDASADGRRMLSAHADGHVFLWDLESEARELEANKTLPTLQRRIAANEKDGAAWSALGTYYETRGAHDWAVRAFEQARTSGVNPPALASARSLWQSGGHAAAAQEFERALAEGVAPECYLALCVRAQVAGMTEEAVAQIHALIETGRFDEAQARIEKFPAQNEYAGPNLLLRAELFYARKNYPEAQRAAEQADALLGGSDQALLLLGKIFTSQGDSARAAKAYARAVERRADPETLRLLGQALEGQKDIDGALRVYQQVLNAKPSDQAARLALARLYREKGNASGALVEATKIIDAEPKHLEARKLRVLLYRDARRTDDALADLGAWINLAPNDLEPLLARAELRIQMRNFDAAIADCSEVLKREPKTSNALILRGVAWGGKEDLAKAQADLDRAVELEPKAPAAWYQRGAVQYRKGDLDGALTSLSKALQLDPNYAAACWLRAQLYVKKDDDAHAAADFTKVIELNPQANQAYLERALARSRNGDRPGALADLNKSIEINAQNAQAWYARAEVKLLQQDVDGALVDISKAIELRPAEALFFLCRARACMLKKDLVRTVADATRALELNPKLADAYGLRGEVFSYQGLSDKALEDLNRYVELDPQGLRGYLQRGFVYMVLGQYEQARADFNKCLDLHPGLGRALEGRTFANAYTQRWDEADTDMNARLKLLPDDAQTWLDGARLSCMHSLKRPHTPEGKGPRETDILRALECLEQAVKKGLPKNDDLRSDPLLAPLQKEPRFVELFGH